MNHDGELIPCPYMDLSIGNLKDMPLKDILERVWGTSGLALIGTSALLVNTKFIAFHNEAVAMASVRVHCFPCLMRPVCVGGRS